MVSMGVWTLMWTSVFAARFAIQFASATCSLGYITCSASLFRLRINLDSLFIGDSRSVFSRLHSFLVSGFGMPFRNYEEMSLFFTQSFDSSKLACLEHTRASFGPRAQKRCEGWLKKNSWALESDLLRYDLTLERKGCENNAGEKRWACLNLGTRDGFDPRAAIEKLVKI